MSYQSGAGGQLAAVIHSSDNNSIGLAMLVAEFPDLAASLETQPVSGPEHLHPDL